MFKKICTADIKYCKFNAVQSNCNEGNNSSWNGYAAIEIHIPAKWCSKICWGYVKLDFD